MKVISWNVNDLRVAQIRVGKEVLSEGMTQMFNILNPCLLHFLLQDLFVNLFQRVFDRYTC